MMLTEECGSKTFQLTSVFALEALNNTNYAMNIK